MKKKGKRKTKQKMERIGVSVSIERFLMGARNC